MSGRRSARSQRGGAVAKARRAPSNPGGVTLSGDQLTAVIAATQQAALATPLPRPPQWSTDPFGPGTPLRPSPINRPNPKTGRAEPRLFELPISTNLNVNTAPFVPWRILSEAADMPLFRKCIERRKSVCQLGYTVTVDPEAVARQAAIAGQATDDVEAAMRKQYMGEISRISDWLQHPDRGNGYDWGQWTSELMENRLVYDATVVYPRRTLGGDVFSFEVPDGSTFKPLLDERGGRPLPPAPFAQQILWGFPRGEFVADTVDVNGVSMVPGGMTTDQLMYERTIIRPKTPYGMSATEIALLDGILWMRRMGWLMKEYTHGVTGALLETPIENDWNTTEWEDWLLALNDKLSGDTAARLEWSLLPPGVKAVLPAEVAERYKPEMDLFLVKLVAGDFGLPASEVGFTEAGALGGDFHEGEQDILERNVRRPDGDWIAKIATRLCVRQLGMPSVLKVQVLGLESEDEAAADAVAQEQVAGGRMTLNEDRARRGKSPYGFAEADMPQLQTGRGVVFLEGASKQGPPGTLIGPAVAPPGTPGVPDAGPQPPGGQDDDDEDEQDGKTSKSAELAALRNWLGKARNAGRTFECRALTAADAPKLADDPRVVFKAAESRPKVPGPSADRASEAAGDDVADGVPMNAVLLRERPNPLTSGIPGADRPHHLVGELDGLVRPLGGADDLGLRPPDGTGLRHGKAESGSAAALRYLVGAVAPVGVEEQVIRADAGRVVARVADQHSGRDRAVGQFPGDAVSQGGRAVTGTEDAVVATVGIAGSHPLPAVSGLVDLGPEAAFKGSSHQVSVPKAWPGWQRDRELVSVYAPLLAGALSESIDTGKLAEAWQALHPKDVTKSVIPPALGAFLGRAGQAIRNALKPVLTRLATEAWVLGNRSALAAVSDLGDVDWGAWTPGDYAAAEQIAGPGLRQLLAEQGIRIKSIADSRLEELSQVLEDTLRSDAITREPGTSPLPPFLSVGDLAGRLKSVLDNPGRAELVAQAEIARAQASAARQVYAETGRTEVEVSTAEDDKVCPQCDAAQKLGAHPLGSPPLVPLHPRCRCAELPVLDEDVPAQAPPPADEDGSWPLSRVGALRSGNEPGMTVEQEYQRKEVQGNYSPNDHERAKRAGFDHPRDYQASITAHVAENGIINAARVSAGTLDEGYHRYAAARQLGRKKMPVQEAK